jgi:hypothetical protein
VDGEARRLVDGQEILVAKEYLQLPGGPGGGATGDPLRRASCLGGKGGPYFDNVSLFHPMIRFDPPAADADISLPQRLVDG